MLIQTAFNFSSVIQRWVCRFSGLRLLALRWLLVFLASSPCAASATSYHFSSSASPPWRTAFSRFAPVVNLGLPVLASGSNRAVKPTCLRQAAYFRTLACEKPALFSPMFYSPAFTFSSVYSLGLGFLAGLRLLVLRQFKSFWPPALVQQAPPAIIFQAVRRFRGALLFHGSRASSTWASSFGFCG